MKKNPFATALMALVLPGAASAAVLYSEDFESYTPGTPADISSEWVVSPGTVDVIGPDSGYDWYGPGQYVDLNGTPDSPAYMSSLTTFDLVAGQTYTLTFDYGNNKNTNNPEGLLFGVGGYGDTIAIAGAIPGLVSYSYTFTATADMARAAIYFQDTGVTNGDLAGPIIDNITLSAVPLPAAGLLLFGALGALVGLRRRRKAA